MEEISVKSQKRADKRRITGNAATDNALWRLSIILKEIAESAASDKITVTHNIKSQPSQYKKVVVHTTKESDK